VTSGRSSVSTRTGRRCTRQTTPSRSRYWTSEATFERRRGPTGPVTTSRSTNSTCPGQYVLYAVQNHGPWRAVTDDVADLLAANDVDVDGVVATDSTDLSSVEALASALPRGRGLGRPRQPRQRTPAGSHGRPGRAGPLSSLLPLLDDVDGERERIEAEADDPTGSQPYDERTRNFDRIAVRRDVAYTVARITRATTDAESLFDEVVHVAGDDTYHDPDTAYKASPRRRPRRGRPVEHRGHGPKLSSLRERRRFDARTDASALHQLEREYVTGTTHCSNRHRSARPSLPRRTTTSRAVRRAALDIELIHDFDES